MSSKVHKVLEEIHRWAEKEIEFEESRVKKNVAPRCSDCKRIKLYKKESLASGKCFKCRGEFGMFEKTSIQARGWDYEPNEYEII